MNNASWSSRIRLRNEWQLRHADLVQAVRITAVGKVSWTHRIVCETVDSNLVCKHWVSWRLCRRTPNSFRMSFATSHAHWQLLLWSSCSDQCSAKLVPAADSWRIQSSPGGWTTCRKLKVWHYRNSAWCTLLHFLVWQIEPANITDCNIVKNIQPKHWISG